MLLRLWFYLPIFSDSWYHLSVIRAFSERGLTGQAWWEFAPFGRPHLYAPLFHLINVAIGRVTPLGLIDLARLYEVLTFPAVLLGGWWAAHCLFGARAALGTLLLLALNIALLFPCSLIIMPGTYAVLLWPFVLVLVLRQRGWAAGLLLGLAGYTHFGVAAIAAVSLLILACLRRECWRTCLLAIVAALVLFSPWLVHLIRHRAFLQSGVARLSVFIPVFTLLGAGLGIVAVIRRPAREPLAVVAMVLASGLFWFTLQERFWTYSGFTFALLGGYGLERCLGRHFKWAVPALLVSVLSVTPFLRPVRHRLALPIPLANLSAVSATPFLTLVYWQRADVAPTIAAATPPEIGALADWITAHVPPGEVLLTNDRLLGECLFALTGRRTTSGLWGEVMTDDLRERLDEYRRTANGYVIVTANESGTVRGEHVASFGRYLVFHRLAK